MAGKNLLLFGGDGTLQAVVGEPKADVRRQAGRYRLLVSTPELLVLRREERPREEEREERLLMAGQIVSPTTVLEIINTIVAARWVGDFHLYGRDSRRTLGFYSGGLRHAASNVPEDRLDKVLCRIGVLNPAQVEAVVREIRPGQRFGELLVERGLVEREKLFGYLARQMEIILLSAVLEEVGAYAFYISEQPGPPPSATVHIPLHSLLLDAAEHVDRYGSFRKLIPDLDLCPEAQPGVEVTRLSPRHRLVLGYSDGRRSLCEIASETWLGRFDTLSATYDLMQADMVRLKPPLRTPEQQASELVEPFNALLGEIYDSVEGRGDVARVRRELRGWCHDSADGRLLDGAVGEDGLVTSSSVAALLRENGSRHQVETLRNTLHELTSFALFSASLWLPREEERGLTRRINHRLKAMGA